MTAGAIRGGARTRRLSRAFRRAERPVSDRQRRFPGIESMLVDYAPRRRDVAEITLESLTKVYPDGTRAVTDSTSRSPTASSSCSSARRAAARRPRCG